MTAIAHAAACGAWVRADDGAYISYPLRHVSAADVESTLAGLLGDDADKTRIVVDLRSNQILVSAPASVHRMAAQLVERLDRPAATDQPLSAARQPSAGADGVPPAQAGPLPGPAAQQAADRTMTQAAAGDDRYGQRAIRLERATAAHVEGVLRGLLGARLQPRAGRGAGLNVYELGTQRGSRVELEFDLQQNSILARGPQQTVVQIAGLVEVLDAPRPDSGQVVRVVPLGNSDRGKLREAIEAYRGNRFAAPARIESPRTDDAPVLRGPEAPNTAPPAVLPYNPPPQAIPQGAIPNGAPPSTVPRIRSVQPGPREQGLLDRATGRQVTHLLMQDPGPGPAGPPSIIVEPGAQPTIVVPSPAGDAFDRAAQQAAEDRLRELGTSVDVEALADLDVIILRGSERDVNELVRIIQEIERISAESVPQVEVVGLQHASSEAVAGIVSQIAPELLAGRQGRASVTALVKPNALLLIGWGEALAALTELVAKLDQPVGPETQLRVFRLRHASAAATRTTIDDFFKGRTGLGPKIVVIADGRSNSLIVQAGPRDLAEVELLIGRLDTPGSNAVNQLRIFRLQNSLASDLAPVIQQAIQASAGARTATGAAAAGAAERSAALEFLTVDARGQQLLKSGVLVDVRITPDPRTNTLLVSAPAESMDLLAALIRQLDDQPAAVAQVKVFRVVNGEATRMVEMLRSLLGAPVAGPAAPMLAGAEGEGSLAPLRFSVDVRTNSIIASGSAGDLTIVEAILLRLDESDVQYRKNAIYRLKNAFAPDVAQAINEFLRSERRVQLAAPGGVSAFRQIESEVVVVPEVVSNSLILSATPLYFDEIRDLVEELDAQPAQVMIQVLIAEVALNNVDEFGIELGLQDSVLFDRSLLGALVTTTTTTQTSTPAGIVTDTNQIIQGATNEPGFNFNSPILPNSGSDRSLATASAVGGQGLSNFGVGRANAELGYGGLVLSASSENVSLLVRALKECRRLDVLSRPQVMTLDNQPAFIQVGQRVPRITNVNVTQFGQNSAVELFNVGLILGVTPRISPDGMVVMEVDAEKSALGPVAEGIPVSFQEGNVILSPRVDVTTAQTTVSAADGQTIVLGGLITKSKRTVNRRVPYLSNIPVVGMLFRYDQFIGQRTELLIILTPHVVRSEADAERVKQLESARMSWCLGDAEKLQGDMGIRSRGSMEFDGYDTRVIYPDHDPRGVRHTDIDTELLQEDPELLGPGETLVPNGQIPPSEALPRSNNPPPNYELPAPPMSQRGGNSSGPLLPAPGNMPRQSVRPPPPSGPQPVVAPITSTMTPTRLPHVAPAGAYPNPLAPAGQASPIRTWPHPADQRMAPPPMDVRPAGFVPAPQPPPPPPQQPPRQRRQPQPMVTGKHPAGGVIPGGASEYLAKPVNKQ